MDLEKGGSPGVAWLDEQQRLESKRNDASDDIPSRRVSQDSLAIERVEAAIPERKIRRRPSNDPALLLPSTFRTL